MKQVVATFKMVIDLSESVQEMIDDGELVMDDVDIREFALDCVQSDLQEISRNFADVKFHTNISIFESGE